MLTSKKGISSLQIQRQMGFGPYETALNTTHKIRTALIQPQEKLGGIVEVDETWIGGEDKNRHWNKRKHNPIAGKTPIIGAVRRKGNVVTRVLERVTERAALTFVNEVVSDKVSLLATDAWRGTAISITNIRTLRSITTSASTSSAFTPTPSRASGPSSSAAWWVHSTK
jgi:hypothetical protein